MESVAESRAEMSGQRVAIGFKIPEFVVLVLMPEAEEKREVDAFTVGKTA